MARIIEFNELLTIKNKDQLYSIIDKNIDIVEKYHQQKAKADIIRLKRLKDLPIENTADIQKVLDQMYSIKGIPSKEDIKTIMDGIELL